ncbi:MAG: helix-turn-helix domain-containing protein [Clostridia bacterium]|nr:helix-turn-helix domain-containing protein [Clostridia bacterium]
MDVIKIGEFIKNLRKERFLTQREVAEQLHVSEKTISKWETGKGVPEISLMLPLCNFFGISMNELLSGERLNEKQYIENAEKNIISLVKDRTSPRKKIIISTISCIFAILSSLALIIISAIFISQTWLRLVMIGIALIVAISEVAVIVLIAVSTEIYECNKCGEKFVPTLSAYILAPHTFHRRYLKCPHCGKKCWDKSHIRK